MVGDAKTDAKPKPVRKRPETPPETQKPLLFARIEREEEGGGHGGGRRCLYVADKTQKQARKSSLMVEDEELRQSH